MLTWPESKRLLTVPGVNLIARRHVPGRGRRHRPLSQLQASWSPTSGLDPQGAPVRRAAGPLGRHLKARIGVGALGAGRGDLERGQPARAAARVLPADQGAPRAWQGDRRHRAQAGGAVLVHAHPRSGLRPPAAVADRPEAAAARARRRRPRPQGQSPPASGSPITKMRRAEKQLAAQAQASYERTVRDWQASAPNKKKEAGASVTAGRA